MHERGMVSHGQQAKSAPVKDVDHPSDARVLAEGDDPFARFGINESFVVNEANVALADRIQEAHVVLLRFDGV